MKTGERKGERIILQHIIYDALLLSLPRLALSLSCSLLPPLDGPLALDADDFLTQFVMERIRELPGILSMPDTTQGESNLLDTGLAARAASTPLKACWRKSVSCRNANHVSQWQSNGSDSSK